MGRLRPLQIHECSDDCSWTRLTNEVTFLHEYLKWLTFWQTGQSIRWNPWLLDGHSVLSPPAGSSFRCYSTTTQGCVHAGERKNKEKWVSADAAPVLILMLHYSVNGQHLIKKTVIKIKHELLLIFWQMGHATTAIIELSVPGKITPGWAINQCNRVEIISVHRYNYITMRQAFR